MSVPAQSPRYSVPATNSLYPISIDRRTAALAASLLVERETGADGIPLLPALPSPAQREQLTRRSRELATHMMPGKDTAMALVLSEMFISLGAAGDEAQANKRTTQYVVVLRHLPLWCVKRACARFSRGDVSAEELGERSFSRGFAPSTAHLHMVAAKIAQPFRDEQADIREVLRARLAYKRSAEEDARITAGMKELSDRLALKRMDQTPHERAYRARGEYLASKRANVPRAPRPEIGAWEPSPELIKAMEEKARLAARRAPDDGADDQAW